MDYCERSTNIITISLYYSSDYFSILFIDRRNDLQIYTIYLKSWGGILIAKWYVTNVISGYETRVISLIKEDAAKKRVEKLFHDFIIPLENIVAVKKGKKVNSERNMFPGYIMINMVLNDLTWNIVKNTQYVAKLLGGSNIPFAIPKSEVERILKQIAEAKVVKEISKSFEIGENVKIISGVFETFNGLVEEIDDEKQHLKVLVSIFGRKTPVELHFDQVEKNNN